MKKFYTTFVAFIVLVFTGITSVSAQQVPNPGFEDWSGAKFDDKIQPKDWNVSNIEQVGIKFNLTHQESGHSGSYSLMVQDTKVGALGITEVSPGYFALGKPWSHLEGIDTKTATAGTSGGINFKYRPDSMSVWIKRTGANVDKEDFYLIYYAWSGTAKSSKYKAKNGGCTSITQTNERVIFAWPWTPTSVERTKKPIRLPKVCGARKKNMANGPIFVCRFIISTMMCQR